MSQPSDKDERKVFRCPNCTQFISTAVDTCRFCSIPITDEIKRKGVSAQEGEDRGFRVKVQTKFLYVGIGVFALGLFLLGISIFSILFTNEGRFFIWSPILILVGLGQIVYGLIGIYEEKKK